METDIFEFVSELDRKVQKNTRDLQLVLAHLQRTGQLDKVKKNGEESGTSGSGQIGVVKSPV